MDDDTHTSLIELMPFSSSLGITLESAAASEVVGRISWAPERCTSGGSLHGGVLMSLADSLGAVCAFLNLPQGASTSTIESKSNFFRPVLSGHVEGRSIPLHVGRRFIVVQTSLFDEEARLVAQTTQTQAVTLADRASGTGGTGDH